MSLMRLEMRQKLSMELRMAPHIIQSIEVLTMPALELQDFIQQQLEINPVLEGSELSMEDREIPQETAETPQEQDRSEDDGFLARYENLQRDRAEYYTRSNIPKRSDGEKDKKKEAMQNMPEKPASLQDYLFGQFQLIEIPKNLRQFGEFIIYNIDSKGYLRYSLEEIIGSVEYPWTLEEAEEVLRHVQKLEPKGIGARNIQECLLLQLDPKVLDSYFYLKKELIEKYLLDIGNNRYPKIVKETGQNLDEIKKAVAAIQKLDPRPGSNYTHEISRFIAPDIVIEWIDGKYVTHLEKNYEPYLKINSMYLGILQEADRKTKEFIKKKLESANWVMDAIKQRQNTLLRVAEKIVEKQQNFMRCGLTHMKPLKMQDLADELQIHVSTVSRSISGKYAQTPRGVFPMKFFFTRGLDRKDGANESRVTVEERIQDLVRQEDKHHPLSDEQIASRLKEDGLEIARRTVTKYRKTKGIHSSRLRKRY